MTGHKKDRSGSSGTVFYKSESAKAFHRPHLLTQTTLSFFFFTLALDARLLVKFALFHFTKKSFLLQLTLENFNRFFDVTINNSDFHEQSPRFLYCLCGKNRRKNETYTFRSSGSQDFIGFSRLHFCHNTTLMPPLEKCSRGLKLIPLAFNCCVSGQSKAPFQVENVSS